MAAAGHPGEDAGLYEGLRPWVKSLPSLELTIPVGKDSMSMKTTWQDNGEDKAVTAPLSLVITAFGRVEDIRKTVTPQLRTDKGDSTLAYRLGRWSKPHGGIKLGAGLQATG